MKKGGFFIKLLVLALLAACSPSKPAEEQQQNAPQRIITAGGAITEVVCALGLESKLIATDRTSTYPPSVTQLPSIGYPGSIKAEGILALGPDLILADSGYLHSDIGAQIESSGIAFHQLYHQKTFEGTKAFIRKIGTLVGEEVRADSLIATMEADWERVAESRTATATPPKVLFIYARGQGTLSVCGNGTFAEDMTRLVGAQMAVTDIQDIKPLTTEALVAANPDYIIFFESGLESIGGLEGALNIPGVIETTAGKNKNILAMDGLLLSGFGPRLVEAVKQLSALIYPQTTTP